MKKIIDKISIKIFDFIYKNQEKKHKKKMDKLLKGKVCGQKIITTNGATLSIKDELYKKDKANQEKIEKIIEKYINEPDKFFDFIKGAKTPIYKIKNADKILARINEQEGFILPKKGKVALYLNFVLNKKISFTTPEMFVLRNGELNTYAFIYQFYNWYCYKMKLSGFENETQEKFKNIFEICETSKIDTLNYEEILNLKSAIKRDIEAIDFVKKMAQKFSMAKKNLEKIKQGQSVNV
ncbi:MAG: hypothetical protein IKU37_05510 [Candidatus Gastranaerophilales bacterium]|nr:hypothetical protein [Candidatus Gastranaerophilales bacterium]